MITIARTGDHDRPEWLITINGTRSLGVFERIFAALVAKAGEPDRPMIDATHLKAHRTAASLPQKGRRHAASDHQGRAEL